MVHFYHDFSKGSEKQIEQIAIEQCNGWHYLRGLLEKWDEIFEPFEQRIFRVNSKMKRHGIYLKTVYKNILPEIKLAISKGAIFINCRICSNKSSEVKQLTDYLYSCRCRVCHFSDEYARIPCDEGNCGGVIIVDGYSSGQTDYSCPECAHKITHKELTQILNDEPVTYDNYMDHVELNCAECDVSGEVVRHGEYYICLNCFHVDEELRICGWCNEGQIGGGSLEFSMLSGCSFCEGSSGGYKDD